MRYSLCPPETCSRGRKAVISTQRLFENQIMSQASGEVWDTEFRELKEECKDRLCQGQAWLLGADDKKLKVGLETVQGKKSGKAFLGRQSENSTAAATTITTS